MDRELGTGSDVRRHRVTRDDLRRYADSIGERRPVYHSVRAARAGGHPDLLAPPTYLFGLTLRTGSPFGWAEDLGVDMRRALHGEQRFDYHSLVHAGDYLLLSSTCSPVERRSGWQHLRRTTSVTSDDRPVATLTTTLLCPIDEGAA